MRIAAVLGQLRNGVRRCDDSDAVLLGGLLGWRREQASARYRRGTAEKQDELAPPHRSSELKTTRYRAPEGPTAEVSVRFG
jgi:hypothetical protein